VKERLRAVWWAAVKSHPGPATLTWRNKTLSGDVRYKVGWCPVCDRPHYGGDWASPERANQHCDNCGCLICRGDRPMGSLRRLARREALVLLALRSEAKFFSIKETVGRRP